MSEKPPSTITPIAKPAGVPYPHFMSNLKRLAALEAFLSNAISEGDADADVETAKTFAASASSDAKKQLASQLDTLLAADSISLEEIGIASNRWFSEESEARDWLSGLRAVFGAGADDGETHDAVVVKDSNGAVLQEGDSVIVIKDLKVKGGSSDLKRGTVVRKIHLIDDPEVIECRVDGSTLVLKTCFLKKA